MCSSDTMTQVLGGGYQYPPYCTVVCSCCHGEVNSSITDAYDHDVATLPKCWQGCTLHWYGVMLMTAIEITWLVQRIVATAQITA